MRHKALAAAIAAITLQEAALIKYSRGKITVLDRPGLERASCECYGRVKILFDELLKAKARRAAHSVKV